jgi:hypothetical protein
MTAASNTAVFVEPVINQSGVSGGALNQLDVDAHRLANSKSSPVFRWPESSRQRDGIFSKPDLLRRHLHQGFGGVLVACGLCHLN